jgi:hypothetical protein
MYRTSPFGNKDGHSDIYNRKYINNAESKPFLGWVPPLSWTLIAMETVAISDGELQIARWRGAILGGKPESQVDIVVTDILVWSYVL